MLSHIYPPQHLKLRIVNLQTKDTKTFLLFPFILLILMYIFLPLIYFSAVLLHCLHVNFHMSLGETEALARTSLSFIFNTWNTFAQTWTSSW